MRIVSGSLKGRSIVTPEGQGTRPTSDRVRESLFSALQSRLLVDGLEKLLLESDERLPEHGGLFLADGPATNLDCLELGSQTTLSGSEAEGLHADPEIRVFTQ